MIDSTKLTLPPSLTLSEMKARFKHYKEGVELGIGALYNTGTQECKKWQLVAETMKDGVMAHAARAVHGAANIKKIRNDFSALSL